MSKVGIPTTLTTMSNKCIGCKYWKKPNKSGRFFGSTEYGYCKTGYCKKEAIGYRRRSKW